MPLCFAVLTLGTARACTSLPGFDCNGFDVDKIDGAPTAMTVAHCCDLCSENNKCAVAVLAPNYKPGKTQCLLKSQCPHPEPNAQRIKVCPDGVSCGAPKPTPAPTPVPAGCSALAPLSFCDVTLSPVARAAALVANLTLGEKVDNVGTNGAAAVPRLGVPAFQWWGEALHGVCKSPAVTFRDPTPNGTSFPEIIGVAATFDASLFRAMGGAVGLEARVMINAGNAGGTFWAPNINIVKDPRWGRLQETPGECPVLAAAYAAHFVGAFQNTSAPSTPTSTSNAPGSGSYVRASSCCKHFAAYSEENWGGLDRFHFDANVSAHEWEDTYLPAFQACIVHGRASGLMCRWVILYCRCCRCCCCYVAPLERSLHLTRAHVHRIFLFCAATTPSMVCPLVLTRTCSPRSRVASWALTVTSRGTAVRLRMCSRRTTLRRLRKRRRMRRSVREWTRTAAAS